MRNQVQVCCQNEEILRRTRLGLWVIRIDQEQGMYELFADDTMLDVMGVEGELTPEECYRYWYDRINDSYYYYVNCAVESMIETGRLIQLEYTWEHPTDGDVIVRCTGIRGEDCDGKICLEGYHRSISNMDKLQYPANNEAEILMEYRRKHDFYKALLSETIAHAELNLDTGMVLEAGGLWEAYGKESRRVGESIFDVMNRNVETVVDEEDVELVRKHIDMREIRRRFAYGERTYKFNYRRKTGNHVQWVRLTLHVFQEDYTDSMYALLYLKDIDIAKKKELATEIEANMDPLTHIDNRRNFEKKVRRFMAGEGGPHYGVFMLFDLDEFKSINDRYGHQGGDMALVHMTKLLQATFRSEDLIGRMGGDEFMVFIRDVSDHALVENRMQKLFGGLEDNQIMPCTFSAGITFVCSEDFSYEECFRQADMALYNSKQKGRRTYSYYQGN